MHVTKKSFLAAALCLASLLAETTSADAQQSTADWAKRWFKENDRDHDAYLTAEEVIAYQLKLLKRMDRFDDGNISPQEYCAGIDSSLSADMARCHRQFAKIDANANGYITAEEVTNYYQLVLKVADVNKDGKVSLDEWLAAAGQD